MGDMRLEEQKQVWRFTFGCGMELAGYCQPIVGTYSSARDKMIEMYGTKWSFQYSEDEWNKILDDNMHPHEIDLETIVELAEEIKEEEINEDYVMTDEEAISCLECDIALIMFVDPNTGEEIPEHIIKVCNELNYKHLLADRVAISALKERLSRTVHLCDTCGLQYPSCNSCNMEFGTGVGNDNVIGCDHYEKGNK